jgi:bacteriocin biosynthesis cyclodehydratase domain-containing protein
VSAATLLRTLALLHGKGLLAGPPTEAAAAADPTLRRQLLFWGRTLGVTRSAGSAAEVQRTLATSSVVLLGTDLFGAATYDVLARSGCRPHAVVSWDDDGFLREALAGLPAGPHQFVHLPVTDVGEAIVRLRPLVEGVDLVLSATRNAPAELFRAVNRLSLERGFPWLRANDSGTQVEVGPYVQPSASGCFRCLELRQASAQDFAVEEHLYQEHLAGQRPAGTLPPVGQIVPVALLGAGLVALEAIRILTGLTVPSLVNAVLTFHPLEGTFRTNRFLRVPRCPECYRGAVPSSVAGPSRV